LASRFQAGGCYLPLPANDTTCSGDAAEKFQELGRADDGIGDAGGLDQFLLGDLGAAIAVVGRPVGSDDGERDMMSDACGCFRGEEIATRRFEELQNGFVLEGWRVRDID